MSHNISLKKVMTIVALIIALILTYCLTIGTQNAENHDAPVYITFGINGVIWTFLLIGEIRERAYSLSMIFWFFCLFFFFFSGLIQAMNNDFPWVGSYDDAELTNANLVLLLWTILFQLGITIARKCRLVIGENNGTKASLSEWHVSRGKVLVLVLISCFITAYRVYNVGMANLFARGTSSFAVSDNGSISVLIEKVMMAIVYFAFIFSVFYWKEKKMMRFVFVAGICLLISYFPTSAARNAVAGLYFGAMLAFFPKMKKNSSFTIIYTLVFMFVFPLLNAFRTVSFSNVDIMTAVNSTISNFSNGWLAVDYDAYSMVVLTLRYISRYGITYGRQLLGVIFFWIPRSVWATKPEGTGPVVAKQFGWWFTNVSEPLPAEMLINFGIVGMAVAAIVCGFIIFKLDAKYWNRNREVTRVTRYDSLYLYMVGYFLFLYRGALLSAFAYLVAFVVVWAVVSGRKKSM